MKAFLLTVISSLYVLLLQAQSSDMNLHFPRSCDVLYYLDFKTADVVTEYGGDGQVWDLPWRQALVHAGCNAKGNGIIPFLSLRQSRKNGCSGFV